MLLLWKTMDNIVCHDVKISKLSFVCTKEETDSGVLHRPQFILILQPWLNGHLNWTSNYFKGTQSNRISTTTMDFNIPAKSGPQHWTTFDCNHTELSEMTA